MDLTLSPHHATTASMTRAWRGWNSIPKCDKGRREELQALQPAVFHTVGFECLEGLLLALHVQMHICRSPCLSLSLSLSISLSLSPYLSIGGVALVMTTCSVCRPRRGGLHESSLHPASVQFAPPSGEHRRNPCEAGGFGNLPTDFVIRLRPADSRSQVDGREDGVPHMPENSAAHVSSASGQHHAEK